MADETKQQSFLIVDENTNNSLYWEMTLKAEFPEAKIKVCKTGFEAHDVSKSEHMTFFISSWEISPMSGFVLMQKIREVRKYKYTPFLIISQVLNEEDLELAQEFGITNYLLKPFDKPRVLEKISAMVTAENSLDNAQKTLRKIEDWVSENKVSEALKLISDFLKPGPHAARAYSLNGDIWSRTEHQEKAEKSYTQALAFEADYAPALSGLGKLLLKQNKYTEAVALFDKMSKKSPRNLSRMMNLGNALLDSGDEAKAAEVFKGVKGVDAENGDAAIGLGKVEFKRGNMDLAAQFFKESGKGDDLASYFNQMAIAMVNNCKFDDAVGVYRNAIKVLPDRNKIHLLEFNIGLAFKKSERLGEATDAFARSLLANPSYEKAYSALVNTAKDAQSKKQKFNSALANEALQKFKQNAAAKQEAS